MHVLFSLFMLAALGYAVYAALGIKTETTTDKYNRTSSERSMNFSPLKALPGAALFVLFLLLNMAYVSVHSGNIGVKTVLGKVQGTVLPGPHFVTPFVTDVYQITTRTLTVKPDEDASSLDLQQVHIQVTLAYHFDGAYMDWLYSNVFDSSPNSAENKIVTPAILEAIKASTAKYSVQQLVEQRAKVRDDIESMVKDRIAPYHITAETVSITDFRFSQEFEKSIEQKQVAQQSAEKAQNDLTRIKVEAEQKIAQAQGEAAALKAQKEQITPELLQLRTIEMMREKWDGKLPENYYGGSAPLPIVETFKKK
jgi:prohibitin 2